MESASKVVEDNLAQFFASWDAHQAELSNPPLSKADMDATAKEEAQKHVNFEVKAINFQISNFLYEIFTL